MLMSKCDLRRELACVRMDLRVMELRLKLVSLGLTAFSLLIAYVLGFLSH